MGLKAFPGIEKVVVRTKQGVTFVIDQPDILRANDTYVVFGEPRVQDNSNQAQLQAAAAALARNAQKGPGGEEEPPALEEVKEKSAEKPAAAPSKDAAPATGGKDESGLDAKDIELVVTQVSLKLLLFVFLFER